MSTPIYRLDLSTGGSWNFFLKAGGTVSGFREGRQKTAQKIKPGDRLLCYLTGVSRFIGVLEVESKMFVDDTPIWVGKFPCRVKVKPLIVLTPETAVPIQEFREELSIFRNLKSPHAWTGRLRGSPARWKAEDGEAILSALKEAKEKPTVRPVDPAE